MEKSPNSEERPSNPAAQHAENSPHSGERPEEGKQTAPDHYMHKTDADKYALPVPDNVEAKHRNPVLAQPPKPLRG